MKTCVPDKDVIENPIKQNRGNAKIPNFAASKKNQWIKQNRY